MSGGHVRLPGTSSFTVCVAIRSGRPGEARHVTPVIDVFDESDGL